MGEPITIPAFYLDSFKKDLESLNRKADKIGVEHVRCEISEPRAVEKRTVAGTKYTTNVVDITVHTPSIKYEGWEFVASIERVGEYNTVRSVPDKHVPEEYRKTDMHCDHCGYTRIRSEVYVLHHEDGRYIQVGSTCIRDFLGGHNAEYFARMYGWMLDLIGSLGEPMGEEDLYTGARTGCYELQTEQFLTTTAFVYRRIGWKSRSAARDYNTWDSTADIAIHLLTSKERTWKSPGDDIKLDPTKEDEAKAREVLAWLRSDHFDPEQRNLSDYEWNLFVVGASDFVAWKNLGILASAQNSMDRQREWTKENKAKEAERNQGRTSEYVGEIKQRLTLALDIEIVRTFETEWGMTTLFIMRDEDGNKFAWFSSSDPGWNEGDTVTLKGTVKKHQIDKYDTKQTVLTRCKEVTN